MGGARWLLSSGLLGTDDTRRTVRDWVVDAAIFAVAVAAGVYVLRSTWDQHSTAVAALDIALGSVACGALWWRRERPGTVALIAIPLSAVSGLAAMAPLPALFNAAIRLPLQAGRAADRAVGGVEPGVRAAVPGRGGARRGLAGRRRPAADRGRARLGAVRARAARAGARPARARAGRGARGRAAADRARDARRARAPALDPQSVHAGALENGRCRRSTRRPRT